MDPTVVAACRFVERTGRGVVGSFEQIDELLSPVRSRHTA
jgi:carbamate kinase